jgi:hypothetical protein
MFAPQEVRTALVAPTFVRFVAGVANVLATATADHAAAAQLIDKGRGY